MLMDGFVTFEGIDGSGKSTVSSIVYRRLEAEGYDVVLTVEPTDSWMGRKVKECIERDMDPFVTTFAFIVDRVLHGREIVRWVEGGKIVLCDRYAESTYAYQGVQLGDVLDNPMGWLKDLLRSLFPEPMLTFLFVVDPKVALDRIRGRGKLISFEKEEFLRRVQDNYLKVCKGERFVIVDAGEDVEKVADVCYGKIVEKIRG